MENEKRKEMNNREVLWGRIYVFVLFFLTSLACCLSIFLWNTDFRLFEQKEYVKVKMDRIRNFRQEQQGHKMVIDSLYHKISGFHPGIHAQYEEEDVDYLINNLRNVYEQNNGDKRYKVFLHVADFYEMWMNDKKQLWSIRQNIDMFKANLEECEIGLQKKMDKLQNDMKK